MTTIDDIKKIKSCEISEILKNSDLTRLVLVVYSELFNCKNPKFCSKSISDYKKLIDLEGFELLKTKNMSRKYVLKPNIRVYDAINFCFYTNENLTDEKAKALLKRNPKLADKFDILPIKNKK